MSLEQLQTTFDEMTPALYNSLNLSDQITTFQVREALSRHIKQNQCYPTFQFWTEFLTLSETRDNSIGYDADSVIVLAGIDTIQSDFSLGLTLGYRWGSLKWSGDLGNANLSSWYASLYGEAKRDCFYIDGIFMAAFDRARTKRFIHFEAERLSPFRRVAQANQFDYQILGHIEVGAILGTDLQINPFLSCDYLYERRQEATETEALSLNLILLPFSRNVVRYETGIEFFYPIYFGPQSVITPYIEFAGLYEQRIGSSNNKAILKTTGCQFSATAPNPSLLLGAGEGGLELTLNECLKINSYYRAEWGSKYFLGSWTAELLFNF